MSFRPLPKQVNHSCFACGHDNPIGLHMSFETDEESLRSCLQVPRDMAGWADVVHGGITATILDEVMSNAAIYLLERIILTRSMQVDLLRPLHVGRPITARAWVEQRVHDRKVWMAAEIHDEGGQLCARGRGDFALFTPAQFRSRGLGEGIVEDFLGWMKQCGKQQAQEEIVEDEATGDRT